MSATIKPAKLDADQLYEQTVKSLPAAERLKLATRILSDIPPHSVVDYSEEWTKEDLRDFSRSSWAHIDRALEEGDDQTG